MYCCLSYSVERFDLLLSKNRVFGYFPNVKNNDDLNLKLVKNLASHDPIINFVILRIFWKKGLIKGDDDFENVMKMEIEDYMKNLQKNYRKENIFDN